MFFWIVSSSRPALTETVTHTIQFSGSIQVADPEIASGLSRFHPVEFARATNGYVYITDGIHAPVKWDGVDQGVTTVGVVPPSAAPTLSFVGTGTITGDYRAFVRYVDDDGNPSNPTALTPVVAASGDQIARYENLPVPTESKVVRRQIFRNTAGQFLTFYLDIDATDLTSTTLQSTRTDTQLRQQFALPLFDDTFTIPLATRFGLPPNDKPLVAFHQNRLWMYGEVVYDEGSAAVTNGSTTVQGYGTEWSTEMANRQFLPKDVGRSYVVESVDEAAQTLTLATPYLGATDSFLEYKIRPLTARRQILQYSEAGLFDAWPASQAIEVASSDDIDDEPTGLVSTHSFLYIIQRRHIYRLTFLEDPALDGGIFLSARRGCVNNRCWVNVDGFMYALDDRGAYRFDGTDATEDLSQNIQDLFYFDNAPGELRVNWDAARWFHASHERHDATIRWFVALSGDRLPRHAICFNYSVPQWWIEEFPFALGDSTVLKSTSSASIVVGRNKKVFAIQVGPLDVVDPDEGDTRALASDWTRTSVTLSSPATLPTAGVVGAPVAIVDGAGKGQWRRVVAVSGRKLTVDAPWTTALDADQSASLQDVSVVQVGAVPWRWKSGWMEWPMLERQQPRKVAVSFQRTVHAGSFDLRLYSEYATEPVAWEMDYPRTSTGSSGVRTSDESPDAVFDTTAPKGYAYLTVDSFDLYDEVREGVVAVELRGFLAQSPFKVFEVDVHGAAPAGGR